METAALDKLEAQAWYPAEKGGIVRPNSAGWPVLLYMFSWGGSRFENTHLCESLASAGYVVFAVERRRGEAPPPLDFSTEDSHAEFLAGAARLLEKQTTDVLSFCDQLAELQAGRESGGIFRNRLALDKIGVLGFSFGGAVAAEACRRDPRFRAGANLDGNLFGAAAEKGAGQPFLFVTDFEGMPTKEKLHAQDGETRRWAEFSAKGLNDMDRWLKTHGGWLVQFDRVSHENFSDAALAKQQSSWHRGEGRDAAQTLEQIAACVVAFFDLTLKGEKPALLDGTASPWPGVSLRRFSPPGTTEHE